MLLSIAYVLTQKKYWLKSNKFRSTNNANLRQNKYSITTAKFLLDSSLGHYLIQRSNLLMQSNIYFISNKTSIEDRSHIYSTSITFFFFLAETFPWPRGLASRERVVDKTSRELCRTSLARDVRCTWRVGPGIANEEEPPRANASLHYHSGQLTSLTRSARPERARR